MIDPSHFVPTASEVSVVVAALRQQLADDLARCLDCGTVLYLAAAVAARFWHEFVWMVYLTMAYATIVGLHH